MRRRHPTPLRFRLFVASALSLVAALFVGVAPASAGTVRWTACFQADGTPLNTTANDPIVLGVGWATSKLEDMNKFLKVQQAVWTITTSTTTYQDDITTFGDTRYWSAPTQMIVNGQLAWVSMFTYNTGVTLAVGEQATLTFSFLGAKNERVKDDNGVVWRPDPVTQVLTPTPPVVGYYPFTATCTLQGQ